MRTSEDAARSILGGALGICVAGALSTIVIAATSSTISLQDVAEMTGTKTGAENRWLARLVTIPKGSDHNKVEHRLDAFSTGKVNHAMGVQTAEALHVLDRDHVLETGETAYINRALKGDRVFLPKPKVKPQGFNLAAVTSNLIKTDTLVTGSVDRGVRSNHKLIKIAQSFRRTMPAAVIAIPPVAVDIAELKPVRVALAKGQMNDVRAAARMMTSVFKKVKEDNTLVAANPAVRSSVSSYAAPETGVEAEMASAFAAVLRPAVKERKRQVIRLNKGDHKWAAAALPRHAYSRTERRCLASGIYFESRSESKKGQQAVAQVILNRVKNPAYPNTVCGVVYQNKWKRNACQFSFACDGIRDRVNSKKHWGRAVKVANAAIDGRFWLASVGSASHYHADYVWPRWRRSMKKMTKIGRHIFYRTYGGGWS